jgi:hypothetical protein
VAVRQKNLLALTFHPEVVKVQFLFRCHCTFAFLALLSLRISPLNFGLICHAFVASVSSLLHSSLLVFRHLHGEKALDNSTNERFHI